MKKLKFGLLALLFTVGVGGAMVQKIHAAPKAFDIVYSWTSPDQGAFSGTINDAEDHYGCTTGSELCARGTAPGQVAQELDKN